MKKKSGHPFLGWM